MKYITGVKFGGKGREYDYITDEKHKKGTVLHTWCYFSDCMVRVVVSRSVQYVKRNIDPTIDYKHL